MLVYLNDTNPKKFALKYGLELGLYYDCPVCWERFRLREPARSKDCAYLFSRAHGCGPDKVGFTVAPVSAYAWENWDIIVATLKKTRREPISKLR